MENTVLNAMPSINVKSVFKIQVSDAKEILEPKKKKKRHDTDTSHNEIYNTFFIWTINNSKIQDFD